MTRIKYTLLVLLSLMLTSAMADDEYPSASPKMEIEEEAGLTEETDYSGSAPIVAHFTSNVSALGDYTPLYEWHIYEAGKEDSPYLIRYDANMDYTFTRSGTSYISLAITFVHGTDTIEYEMEEPFSVQASESVLHIPNAFSPNGDRQNDVFKAKSDYKSIIKFHGYIFNRYGKKLYEWTDITQGWDGKHSGHDVADGVYFCKIEAEGADGKQYHIHKAINLLRGYDKSTTTSGAGQ